MLDEVLVRLGKAGLHLKNKCVFLAPSVSYLGFCIDSQGLHPLPEKVRAIQDSPKPSNVTELKSFLGLVQYYSKFLPNLSIVLAPLYRLLCKGYGQSQRGKHLQKQKSCLHPRGGYRNLEGGGLIIIFTRGQSPRNQRLFIISSSKFFTNMCNKYSSLLHAHNTHYETIHA